MKTTKKSKDLSKIMILQRQLDFERSQNTPLLIKTGSIRKNLDVIEYLNEIPITSNHLLILSEILVDHMWHETEYGLPDDHRTRVLKDIQFNIQRLFEIGLAAKFLHRKNKKKSV
jgi:hypothetical protein